MEVLAFIVLAGALILAHELGHLLWAKILGVKVIRFSIGFGPGLLGFRRGETEYVVAIVPLGGYVKMLGEHASDVVAPSEQRRSFSRQPSWKRIMIVIAGPAMNLVLPFAIYFLVFLGDTRLQPPVVGMVFPGRPADGELEPGDRITAIDGESVASFYDVRRIVAAGVDRPLEFEIERDGERMVRTVRPVATREERPLQSLEESGRIGIMPHRPLPVVGVVHASSPAGVAQIRTMDVIASVGGHVIRHWSDLETALSRNRGTLVPLTYLRPVRLPSALGGLVEMDVLEPHVTTLTPVAGPETGIVRAGFEPADLYVSHVTMGFPEHQMGLLPGDRLVELDGNAIRLWATFIEDLKAGRDREHTLTWRRGDHTFSRTFRVRHERGVDAYGQSFDRYVVGIRNWMPVELAERIENPRPVLYAIRQSVDSTLEMMELTLLSVVRLLQGRLSMKSIGGPLAIFQVAGTAAREGTLNYLALMAFISINLGFLNLLPIPILDGGHLLFFAIEAVIRRPIPARLRQWASLVGLVLLLMLTVLAFKNDIERQWPQIADALRLEE